MLESGSSGYYCLYFLFIIFEKSYSDNNYYQIFQDGKPEYLEGLLQATKELSHIDRSNIFYHLLVTYCKSDETDKALGLWTLLQEEDEVPSDQFLIQLGNHLRSKNRAVPFVIPREQPPELRKKENIVSNNTPKKTRNSQMPNKDDLSASIEGLVQNGLLSQAMDVTMKSIENGVMPKSNVLKFLLKNLGQEGNVEKIQQFGKHITEQIKRKVTYDDKLTLAIFVKGAGPEHVDRLYEAVQATQDGAELEAVLRKFPRSSALSSTMSDDELVAKCMYSQYVVLSG